MSDEKAPIGQSQHHFSGDPLWQNAAYRFAVEVAEGAWYDSKQLYGHGLTRPIADQLYRAACSIGANFTDGYGRSSAKDRVRFFEYSLCSARECHFWYDRARHTLAHERIKRQQDLLSQICKLLLTMIPRERKRSLGGGMEGN